MTQTTADDIYSYEIGLLPPKKPFAGRFAMLYKVLYPDADEPFDKLKARDAKHERCVYTQQLMGELLSRYKRDMDRWQQAYPAEYETERARRAEKQRRRREAMREQNSKRTRDGVDTTGPSTSEIDELSRCEIGEMGVPCAPPSESLLSPAEGAAPEPTPDEKSSGTPSKKKVASSTGESARTEKRPPPLATVRRRKKDPSECSDAKRASGKEARESDVDCGSSAPAKVTDARAVSSPGSPGYYYTAKVATPPETEAEKNVTSVSTPTPQKRGDDSDAEDSRKVDKKKKKKTRTADNPEATQSKRTKREKGSGKSASCTKSHDNASGVSALESLQEAIDDLPRTAAVVQEIDTITRNGEPSVRALQPAIEDLESRVSKGIAATHMVLAKYYAFMNTLKESLRNANTFMEIETAEENTVRVDP